LGVHLILSGKVKIYRTSRDGRRHIIRIDRAGDVAGYRAVLAGGDYGVSAEALETTRVSFVGSAEFVSLFQSDPSTSLFFLNKLATELRDTEVRLVNVVRRSAAQRTAQTLCQLLKIHGSLQGGLLNITLSRGELGELADLTPETTIRMLGDLQRRKLIKIEKRKISILQPEEIFRIAGIEY
jgi:CRP/FNR family transcriptional regulator